jgi:hypothetical protein
MSELDVIRAVDFDWAMRLSEVWNDAAWDVPDLHANVRAEFVAKLEAMRDHPQTGPPLGWVIVGLGGAGKTHLLGAFRREAVRCQAGFVLVDMTDVRDFWETVLQGYLDSLQQPYEGGRFQHQSLLGNLIQRMRPNKPVSEVVSILAHRKSTDLIGDINKILGALAKVDHKETLKHQNVVRALTCLNSVDFSISSLGMTWLQGQEIEPADKQAFGFTVVCEEPLKIVEALSWLMSLSGPTILAFDQLDPIVTQHYFKGFGETSPEEQNTAKAIIAAIGGGLGALRDVLRNTLAVVACLESTWDILHDSVLKPSLDRFEPPRRLDAVKTKTVAEAVVRTRLAIAFGKTGFSAKDPPWPFRTEAFEELKSDTPREVLKKCEAHRQRCLRDGVVRELTSFVKNVIDPFPPPNGLEVLDQRFADLKTKADLVHLIEEKHEDEQLAPLLQAALQCLIRERDLPAGVDAVVDSEFPGGQTTKPLHARLRLIFHNESGREEHFCVRVLQRTNPKAYQARLKAAMTQSGIDKSLKFRRLTVVRTEQIPGGDATQKLTDRFEKAGGLFFKPSDDELRTLHAIPLLKEEGDPAFERWLRSRQPVSKLPLIRTIVSSPLLEGQSGDAPSAGQQSPDGRPDAEPMAVAPASRVEEATTRAEVTAPEVGKTALKAEVAAPKAEGQAPPPPLTNFDLPLGRRLTAGKAGDVATVPVRLLEKHTIVLAGAGSGKTVLLRRLVEEVALLGIPAIVIDGANDLATFDERWPTRPEGWLPEDDRKAERYHAQTDVILWTPGRENGNPLAFEPLPDLAAVSDDAEELEAAVAMVRESLDPIVASGPSAAARNKQGILSSSLRYFAKQGGGRLADFIALLDDLPPEAGLGVANEARLAAQMADALKVAVETNPLLRSAGPPLDPAVLFGDDRPSQRVRISLVNFVGLPGLEAQRHFLNQLAMTLFSWIKKNPNPGPRLLRGLLVIDEAKDFVPSQKASACKEGLMRLAAQARKYHLGLIFATQNPKDIENKIVANCSTHYYGKVNSPAAIDAVQELIRSKGGSGDDVPRLPRGQFYVHNADAHPAAPIKVTIPLCLSRHPDHPLDEAQILQKAAVSRKRLNP